MSGGRRQRHCSRAPRSLLILLPNARVRFVLVSASGSTLTRMLRRRIHTRFGMAPMVCWTAAATRLGLVMPMLLEPVPMCVDDQLPTCQGAIVCQPEP